MDFTKIGSRIREEREKRKWTQEALADEAGLKNRHAVSSIEKGERDARYSELVNISAVLGIDLSDFAPSKEPQEAALTVLWRKEPIRLKAELEAGFLQNIRSYDLLERALGVKQSPSSTLEIFNIDTETFNFKDAYDLAETTRTRLGLGNEPAKALAKVLEDQFDVRIFYTDLENNGSAASHRTGHESAVLLNQSEPPWRRNYSLAHELFHLITWTPKVFEQLAHSQEFRENLEKFAEAFAAGLLMPAEHLRREFDKYTHEGKISTASIVALARQFDVSISALLYRLAFIGLLNQGSVKKLLSNKDIQREYHQDMHSRWNTPAEFPDRFVRLSFQACAQSKVSRTKVATLLKLPLVDLPEFFENNGFPEGADEDEIEIATA